MLTLARFRSFSDKSLEAQHRLVELRKAGWTPRESGRRTLGDKKKRKKRHIAPYGLTSARH